MTDAHEQSGGSGGARMVWLAGLVFVSGCIMGAGSLGGEFLSGDDVHLVLNHVLVNHPSLEHAFKLLTIMHRDLYQPIPLLSFSLDFAVIRVLGLAPVPDGPSAGAWVFHLTNVLIHAANGVLVFWLFRRLHRRAAIGLLAALIFVLHPYAAEVVTWLNGRMMLLATLFSMASLITLDAYLVRRRWWLVALTLLFVVLTMTSKVRVGLPVLMLLLPLVRRHWPSRKWWATWVAAGVLTAGFTLLALVSTSASEMFEGAAEKLQGSRIARTVLVLAWYFEHYLVPAGMSPWHPPELLVTWSHPGIPWAVGLLVGLAALTVWSWRYTRVGVLGMVWFLSTVASTLPLLPARDVMAADRYVYMPNIGLHWIIAALLVHAVLWCARRWAARWLPYAAGVAAASGAAALLPYTWHVESFYLSNIAKAKRIAEVYPDEPGVWEDLGWAYYRDGQFEKAIQASLGDLERHPEDQGCEVYQLKGMALFRMGRADQAIDALYKAVELDPDYGKCYSRLGHIYYELGRLGKAEEHYLRAVEIMPEYLPAIKALALIYQKTGRADQAAKWYRRGLEINEYDPKCSMGLAELDMAAGRLEKAVARFEELLGWQPENTTARTNLGVCYAQLGRGADAMEAYEQALRRDPGAVTAAMNLAALKADVGDTAGAVALARHAAAQAPTNRIILVAAHDILLGAGRLRDAGQMWANAAQAEPQTADFAAWYAWTSALAGQVEAAAKGASAALNRDEGLSLAWAALVLADLAAEHPEQADQHMDRVLGTPPEPPDAWARLRRALGAAGSQNPDDPWPYYLTARLLAAQGEDEAARLGMEEFVRRAPSEEWRRRAVEVLGVGREVGSGK